MDIISPICEVSMVRKASFHARPNITLFHHSNHHDLSLHKLLTQKIALTSQPSQISPLKSLQSSPEEVSLICQDKLAPQTV